MTAITKPPPGATIDYGHQINRGLVGRWLFNEGAGSRVADISGNSAHGTINNVDSTAAWVGSPHGGAFATDGVDDHISVASEGVTRFNRLITDGFSLSAWVNSNDIAAQRIVGGGQRSSGSRYTAILATRGTDSEFSFWVNPASGQVTINSGEVHTNGRWYHLVGTYGAGTARFYVDTELKGTNSAQSGDVLDFNEVVFGEDINLAGTRAWNGSLSNIRMYNRALGIEDIRVLNVSPFVGLL